MFLAQTCVVLGAVRGGHLCHLGLQLLEAWRSILPCWVCQEEVEKVRWIRNSKVEVTQQENVSHLSNCCCLPACWAWSSGETSDWNLNTQRTIVERVFVYSNKAVALLTAGNVTGRNKHPWTDSQLLWSQTVARLAGHNTHVWHTRHPHSHHRTVNLTSSKPQSSHLALSSLLHSSSFPLIYPPTLSLFSWNIMSWNHYSEKSTTSLSNNVNFILLVEVCVCLCFCICGRSFVCVRARARSALARAVSRNFRRTMSPNDAENIKR